MSRKNESRKIVKLSDSLHRELTGYVLAAGAAGVSVLALATPSEGQIVYTPAHERIEHNGTMLIDLNHDGTTDLTIREIPWKAARRDFENPGNSVQAITPHGGGIRYATKYFTSSRCASSLRRGASIGPASPFRWGAEVMAQATDYGVYYAGCWSEDAVNGFLGIRFRIGNETHYGWARLDLTAWPPKKGIRVILTGYAYETQPDTPIRAGDTGGADADDNSAPTSEIFPSFDPQAEGKATLGSLALGADGLANLSRTAPPK